MLFFFSMSVRSAISTIMRAIRVTEFGGPQVLKLETNVPVPRPSEDQVYNAVFSHLSENQTHIKSMLELFTVLYTFIGEFFCKI